MTHESAAEWDSKQRKQVSDSLAHTSPEHRSLNSSSHFPQRPNGQVSAAEEVQGGLYSVFLADPRLSSPRSGARDVLALRTMRPKLSTCGHVWCPAAACSHVISHLTLCEPTLVLWEPHKEPAATKESCSYVCSCICFLPPVTQYQIQTPTA